MSRRNLITDPLHTRTAPRLGRAQRRRLERAAGRKLNRGGLPLLARLCLVVMFPFSGYDKVVHWNSALQQADSSIVPKAAGPAMLTAGMVVELIAPVCIVTGWHDRLAAFILAGFCVVTAFLFHPFWQFSNFWSPSNKEGNAHLWDFLKNFGLVGGLLLLVIGGDPVRLSEVLEHPLGSAPMRA